MADSRSFVHFSHPGREHKPDRGCGKVWNTSTRSHMRQFMQLRGECTKGDGSGHNGDLRATRGHRKVCSRVERRRVAGRVRWLIRCFRSRAAVRFPWARFLPPLSEPGGPVSGTGLSSGIMRLAHGFPIATNGRVSRTVAPGPHPCVGRPGVSSDLLTPWRRRPLGSSPSLVHVMTSGISAHLRGTSGPRQTDCTLSE